MPFDPDAYLAASPAPSGGFDPDAYLAAPAGPSMGQSALMGAGGSASFGLNDELGGFLGAIGEKLGIADTGEVPVATTREGVPIAPAEADAWKNRSFGDVYRGYRDEIRSQDDAAREAHPWAYHGAGLATAAVNPIGVAAKGASTGARIAAAADVGALTGLGNSRADLTEGDVGGALRDTAIGAGAGAVAGTVAEGVAAGGRALGSRLAAGAEERQATRNVDTLLEKTPAVKTQDKANAVLGGKAGISRVLKDEGLEPYVRKAKEGLALAEEKADDVGSEIGSIYAKVDEKYPAGVARRSEVYDRLNALLDGYAEKDQVAKFSALKSMMGKLEAMDSHLAEPGAEGADRMMGAEDIFNLKKQLNQIGYTGASDIAPLEAKQAARDAGEIVRDFLAERVDNATGEAKRLGELNSRWRDLNQIRDVFEAKATRDARNAPGLGDRMKEAFRVPAIAAGAAAGLASLSHGNIPGAVAGLAPAAAYGAPAMARGMDSLLISLGNAARSTSDPAGLIRRAVQLGIPEETAAAVVRNAQGQGAQPY